MRALMTDCVSVMTQTVEIRCYGDRHMTRKSVEKALRAGLGRENWPAAMQAYASERRG